MRCRPAEKTAAKGSGDKAECGGGCGMSVEIVIYGEYWRLAGMEGI